MLCFCCYVFYLCSSQITFDNKWVKEHAFTTEDIKLNFEDIKVKHTALALHSRIAMGKNDQAHAVPLLTHYQRKYKSTARELPNLYQLYAFSSTKSFPN